LSIENSYSPSSEIDTSKELLSKASLISIYCTDGASVLYEVCESIPQGASLQSFPGSAVA